MKKIITSLLLFLVVSSSFAQAPQGMNYQAVARNTLGAILANQNICVQSTITNGNVGPILYQETFNVTTNQFGLFSLSIGNGLAVSGTFSSINWGAVTPWQKIEIKVGCTGSYVTMGSSMLMSVPYALSSPITNKYSTGLISSSVRNADVISPDSTIVTQTGDYLILFEIIGTNSNQYLNSASYDNTGNVVLRLLPSTQLSNYVDFFKRFTNINGANLTYWYYGEHTTSNAIQHLQAGDVIKAVAHVNSTGTPTGSWSVYTTVTLVKLK